MAFSKAKVTIDLDEYQELLKLKQQSENNETLEVRFTTISGLPFGVSKDRMHELKVETKTGVSTVGVFIPMASDGDYVLKKCTFYLNRPKPNVD